MTQEPKIDDAALAAWQARHTAFIADVGKKSGFDETEDRATLIARYFEATSNRYSPLRDDPVLKPILDRAAERYGELRRHDFSFANKVANIEAVRAILEMEWPPRAEDAQPTPGSEKQQSA